jgi:Txe/YoeB family toxin of Txe-Axe toxin-antitoxin module
MDNWQLVFTKQAKKDAEKLARTGLAKQANELLNIPKSNPYQSYPESLYPESSFLVDQLPLECLVKYL